ncbi:hypothetical protein PGSY75_1007800 [Plasmodium gaboni]|uniref:Uncharacterized protein n=1 Tax=Plasmodium gaboni TaxID=647221 RepID=A0A151LKC6_9APIC|nr:hypothetical protein PGSY75_1007800 [Plasmodium gaboni]KYN99455.1 hypothetical protein PGSY75_1007800 [Plasmodium gaboni]
MIRSTYKFNRILLNNFNEKRKNLNITHCVFLYTHNIHSCFYKKIHTNNNSQEIKNDTTVKNNNNNNIYNNKEKSKNKIYSLKYVFAVGFLFLYGTFECINIIQHNEDVQKKIKIYPSLYNIIDKEIIPLKIKYDKTFIRFKTYIVEYMKSIEKVNDYFIQINSLILKYYYNLKHVIIIKITHFLDLLEKFKLLITSQETNHMVKKINEDYEKNINEKIHEQGNRLKGGDTSDYRNNNEKIYISNHSEDRLIQSTSKKDDIKDYENFYISDEGEANNVTNNDPIDNTRKIITDVDDKYLQDDIKDIVELLDNQNLFHIKDVEYNKENKSDIINKNVNTSNYLTDLDLYEYNMNMENYAENNDEPTKKNLDEEKEYLDKDYKNFEDHQKYPNGDDSNTIYISKNEMNKNIDYHDNTNYTVKGEEKDIYTIEEKINQNENYDQNIYVENMDKNIYEDINKYAQIERDTNYINEKDKDTIILTYNNEYVDNDAVKNIYDINLIQSLDVEKKCPITYSEETNKSNNKMVKNCEEGNVDNINKNICNHDEHNKIDTPDLVMNNVNDIKKKNINEKNYRDGRKKINKLNKSKKEKSKKSKHNVSLQNHDNNTTHMRTYKQSKKYNIIQNMLYNDKHFNNIFDKKVKQFEDKIDKLNEKQLKNKIIKMFVNELVSEKYNHILLEDEKGTLIKVLSIKYKDIFLKKKKKFEKYMKKFLLKKLKADEKILKQNYMKENKKFQNYMINIKNEELEKEKKKIEEQFQLLQENYLKKMNIYISHINNIKDIFTKEINNKFNLQKINNIQNKLVNLQNCLLHDISIEHILIELKKDLHNDIYLNKLFKILPNNFFSHIFKPSNNNNEELKKEFYYLYEECVQQAFLNKDDNYFKQILGKIMSYIYIKYEYTLNNILISSSNHSILKNNLLNLSYALSSIQHNKLIDTLRYTNDLTGNCKEIFLSFNEHIKNVILFKFYLRLVVSRIMLLNKTLNSCD